jgi:hypothetical protein
MTDTIPAAHTLFLCKNTQPRRGIGDSDAGCIDELGLHDHVTIGLLDNTRPRVSGSAYRGSW